MVNQPLPLFYTVVVREVIENSQKYIDLLENNPKEYIKIFGKNKEAKSDEDVGLLSDLSAEFQKALLLAPVNSIVGVNATPGYDYDTRPKIYYPLFPPHMSLPIKPGETVWILNPGTKDSYGNAYSPAASAPESVVSSEVLNFGYWVCRCPSPGYVDDLNFTHNPRERSFYYRKSQDPDVKLADFPPNFVNGFFQNDQCQPIIHNKAFDFKNIREKSLSNKNTTREAVPRFTKRPGDFVLQGSNNTLICLGEDRPASKEGSSVSYPAGDKDSQQQVKGPRTIGSAGTIDIVAGRGRSPEGSPKNITKVKNTLGQDEGEKRTWARDESKKRIVKITEGDPDLINDLSRVYISMKTNGDRNFGYSESSKLPNPGTELAPKDGKPYVVIKSNEARIISRKDGSIRIIKEGSREGSHSKDQAVITMQSDGTIMIDGPKIIIGSGKEKSYGRGNQVFIGEGATQPLVLGDELKEVLESLIDQILLITHPAPFGATAPGLINEPAFRQIRTRLSSIRSKVGKTK